MGIGVGGHRIRWAAVGWSQEISATSCCFSLSGGVGCAPRQEPPGPGQQACYALVGALVLDPFGAAAGELAGLMGAFASCDQLRVTAGAGGTAQQRVVAHASAGQAEPVLGGSNPTLHRSILGAVGEQAAIGAECHRHQPIMMALEPVVFWSAQTGLPQGRSAVAHTAGIAWLRLQASSTHTRAWAASTVGKPVQCHGHLGAQAGHGGMGASEQGLLFSAAPLLASYHCLLVGPLALLLGGGEGLAFLLLGLAQLHQRALGVAFAGQGLGLAGLDLGFRLFGPPRLACGQAFLHEGLALGSLSPLGLPLSVAVACVPVCWCLKGCRPAGRLFASSCATPVSVVHLQPASNHDCSVNAGAHPQTSNCG